MTDLEVRQAFAKLPHSDENVELDETNCSHEALEFISRPDAEKNMPMEEWEILYQERLKDGYYDRKKAKNDAMMNDQRVIEAAFGNSFNEVWDAVSKEYDDAH